MNEIKWYWWVLGILVILYFVGKQKNLSLQQEVSCIFGFCGTLSSGDSFNGTISTINPGVTEGNLSHACAPIGVPTSVHCNLCHPPVINPLLPNRIISRPMLPVAPRTPATPSLPTFHAPAALAPPAPSVQVGYTSCSLRRPYVVAPTSFTYYCNFVGQFRTVARH